MTYIPSKTRKEKPATRVVRKLTRLLEGASIKKGKDGNFLSCSIKTEEEERKANLPFQGVSYRNNSSDSELCAPYMASFKRMGSSLLVSNSMFCGRK